MSGPMYDVAFTLIATDPATGDVRRFGYWANEAEEVDRDRRRFEHEGYVVEVRPFARERVCTCGGVGFGQHISTCPVVAR